MKLTCNTIQDILPLVVEDLASEDTVELVNAHIETCPRCNEEYMELKSSKTSYEPVNKPVNKPETLPLKVIKRKLKNKNVYIGLLSGLIICLLLIIVFNIATKPIPLSYMEAIESSNLEDGRFFVEFSPLVSNYSIESYGSNHDIMAWKTNLSKFIHKGEPKNTLINIDNNNSTKVYYIAQANEEDKLLYGKVSNGGRMTLPRLVLNSYLLIMISVFIIGIFLYLIFKKTVKIREALKIIIIFALSYILGHISIFGASGITHHIIRDFSLVIVSCILYFSIIILLVYKDFFLNIKSRVNK